ncbi:TRAP transporter small permease [bacterium]|nr:TRAP transporter small permease [bacterium]
MIKIINSIVAYLLMALMAAIVLDVSWQVIARYIPIFSSSFTEELAGFLLIWIGLLGASHALYTKSHLGIDLLTYKLKGVKRRTIEIIVYSLVALFAFFVMVIGGFRLVNLTLTLEQISPDMKIQMGYVYTVLPLSGILMMLYSFLFILKAVQGKDKKDSAEHHVSALD